MVTLEQVKLLETKVVRAIDYVERISRENSQLQGKLDSYQKRIDELEVLIQQFKEDQGRIEEGILAALDRLNRFEDAVEKSIADPPLEAKAIPGAKAVSKAAQEAPPKAAPGPKAAPESRAASRRGAEKAVPELELPVDEPEIPPDMEMERPEEPGAEEPEESFPHDEDGENPDAGTEEYPPDESPASGELYIF
jgi:TolA-binding protein